MDYKVFIPSAGVGSRLGPHTKLRNKALITLGDLPVIVRIIRQFPKDVEFVIALGHCGEQIKQSIQVLCPEYTIEFVYISKYEGEGASLGLTILECQKYLQSPFIFTPNDTLVDIDHVALSPVTRGNWAGYYKKITGDQVPVEQYRTLDIHDGQISQFNPKGLDNDNIYIGLSGILDYQLFWKIFRSKIDITAGEVIALNLFDNVSAVEFESWEDIGNLTSLQKSIKKFRNSNYNILEKENEAIWFSGTQVTKFHVDNKFISDRIKRLDILPSNLFPKLTNFTENTYSYEKVNGKIFSSTITPVLVKKLLNEMQKSLWQKKCATNINFDQLCDDFYRLKTKARLEHFFSRYEKIDKPMCVNNVNIPKSKDLLESVPWANLVADARFAHFHGDFHSENILVTEDQTFCLLDWRQNFGDGNYTYGDVNYDLAKFLHGLIVSHKEVENNNFEINKLNTNTVHIDIKMNYNNYKGIETLQEWCYENGYNFENIELLTGLIFLNICGLHEHPYSEFLYYLGILMVFESTRRQQVGSAGSSQNVRR